MTTSTSRPRSILENGPLWFAERIGAALSCLGGHPATLFAVLLCANAVVAPHVGFVHDARLYGMQVLSRISSSDLPTDLFLRYGSQDQYTPFSMLATPVVRLIGLDWF